MSDQAESSRTAKFDAAFAVSMIIAAAVTIWGVRNQPKAPYDPVGAAAVPFWTAVIVLILAVLLLARVLLKLSTRGDSVSMFTMSDAIDESYAVRPWLSVQAIVLSFIYTATIPILGFMYASLGFMLILGWLLSDRSRSAVVLVVAVAVGGSVALDLGFRALLIDLP